MQRRVGPQCLILQLVCFYSQSLIVVEHYFPQYAIVGQDLLGSKASVDKVLSLLPEDILCQDSCIFQLFTFLKWN